MGASAVSSASSRALGLDRHARAAVVGLNTPADAGCPSRVKKWPTDSIQSPSGGEGPAAWT